MTHLDMTRANQSVALLHVVEQVGLPAKQCGCLTPLPSTLLLGNMQHVTDNGKSHKYHTTIKLNGNTYFGEVGSASIVMGDCNSEI